MLSMATILKRLRHWPLTRRRKSSEEPERAARQEAALVRRLSEVLYREELKQGGWAAEIGSLGPGAYRGEASWILREVALGNAQSGPPTP